MRTAEKANRGSSPALRGGVCRRSSPALRGGVCWWLLAFAIGACVDAKPDDPMGAVSFHAGYASLDTDYAGGAGGSLGATPMMTAATGATAPVVPMGGNGSAGMGVTPAGTGGTMAVAGMGATGVGATGGAAGAATGGIGGSKAGSGGMVAAGMGGSAGMAGSAGNAEAGSPSSGGSSMGMLTIQFTTVNQGGRYAPANVGAVWIETDSGMFVKTIKRWGTIRYTHLTAWSAASGGWPALFFGGGNAADQMDAISSATERTHGMRMMTWDMQDPMGKLVPDGKYKVRIEVTEDNFTPGANGTATFTKGPMPDMESPADQKPWSGLTLDYKP
jgi:hypothetical protein